MKVCDTLCLDERGTYEERGDMRLYRKLPSREGTSSMSY